MSDLPSAHLAKDKGCPSCGFYFLPLVDKVVGIKSAHSRARLARFEVHL